MPAPHALYSKMLAERTALRDVFVLFYLLVFAIRWTSIGKIKASVMRPLSEWNKTMNTSKLIAEIPTVVHRLLLVGNQNMAAGSLNNQST